MSRSASGALLAWTDKGGVTSSEKVDMVRIALRLAGFEPRAGTKLTGAAWTTVVEALLPEAQRPSKRDRSLSLARCVSVMLGGVVPEDKVLTLVVNKTDADGKYTQNSWQARARGAGACTQLRAQRGRLHGGKTPVLHVFEARSHCAVRCARRRSTSPAAPRATSTTSARPSRRARRSARGRPRRSGAPKSASSQGFR
jgi:hypothetical protein